MTRRYSMDDAHQVGAAATTAVERWLRRRPETVEVQDVTGDAHYQQIDVDLIWQTGNGRFLIEIKGDRWDRTGNFFFETVSNQERGTPGCFLYTQADYLFYYFVRSRVLYVLPMPATRGWFIRCAGRYPERATTTPVGAESYTTIGRLVPIADVLNAVRRARRFRL